MNLNTTPFLTLPDPEVAIKGSRDPLGYEVLWIGFGRKIVSNLTTVTTSLRGFTTLMLGYHFASRIINTNSNFTDDDFVGIFMKFEQMVAYSRYASGNYKIGEISDIRGIQRVERYYGTGKGRVTVSALHRDQILAEQKTYGLWGLFSVSAGNSGIVERDLFRLTPAAQDFIDEHMIPVLDKNGNMHRRIEDILVRKSSTFEPCKGGRDEKLAGVLARLHELPCSESEKNFYTRHLIYGGDDGTPFQKDLWVHFTDKNDGKRRDFWSSEYTRADLHHSLDHLGEDFADILRSINALDWLLRITNDIFIFLLSKHGFKIKDIVPAIEELRSIPGLINIDRLESVRVDIARFSDSEHAERMLNIARLIKNRDYADLVDALIFHNAEVMKRRWGGGAWIVIKDGLFDVRFGRENVGLTDPGLDGRMFSTYFMNSIKQIGKQVYGY